MLSTLWADILVPPSLHPLCWSQPQPISLGEKRSGACLSQQGFVAGALLTPPAHMGGQQAWGRVPSMGMSCPSTQQVRGCSLGTGVHLTCPPPLADAGGEGG